MRAVITGGSSGIGFATAQVLGREGYEIIVVSFDEKQQEPTLKALAEEGIKASYYAVGGLGGRHEITDMPTEFMRKVMALNFDSVFFVTRACLPLLKKGTNPSIVNFSTIAVTSGGGPGAAIYSASKGAVQSYTRGLAKDLIQFGIRVNAVSPGTIDTPFHAATARELVESWKAGIPMGRLGEASEVATVIKFLASPDASYITGEVIQINGGQAFI